MIKAIIFDLDGVIVNSEKAHINSFVKSLKKYNIQASKEDISWCRGMSLKDIFKYVLNKHPPVTESIDELIKRKKEFFFNEELKHVEIVEGFDELLNYLRDKYLLALVTSCDEEHKKAIFDKFKLNNIFSVVMTSDNSRKSKPNSEPFRKTIKKLNVEPNQCVVIEDSSNGITSANLAGAKTIGLACHADKNQLINANIIIDKLKEIIPLLENNKI